MENHGKPHLWLVTLKQFELMLVYYRRMCSTDNFFPLYFLRISKVWSMLHEGSMGRMISD